MGIGIAVNEFIRRFIAIVIFRLKCFLLPAACGVVYLVLYTDEAGKASTMTATMIMAILMIIVMVVCTSLSIPFFDLSILMSACLALVCVAFHLLLVDLDLDKDAAGKVMLVFMALNLSLLLFVGWYLWKSNKRKALDNEQEYPANKLPPK
jgi:hypothetical protein